MNSRAWILSKLRFPLLSSLGGTGATSMGAGAVGTVSQASGIPTGAIIERGVNAYGEYVKYADGTLICTSGNSPQATGVIAANNVGTALTITMPASFVNTSYVALASAGPNSSNDHYGITNNTPTAVNTVSVVIRNGATAQTFLIKFIAIGRWY